MTGRHKFGKYRIVISAIVLVFRAFPQVVLESMWPVTNVFHGGLGNLLRYAIARNLAKRCGSCVYFGHNVTIRHWSGLQLGSNVSVHANCWIDASGEIDIGDDVSIAHCSSILSTDHSWLLPDIPIKYNPTVFGKVVISNDVWIGCGCRILAGVELERRTVVAAGAVVTKSFPGGVVIGGCPARVIKDISA